MHRSMAALLTRPTRLARLGSAALLALFAGVALQAESAPAMSGAPPASWVSGAESIAAPEMETWVRALASDKFEGRGPGSPGEKLTRDYLIKQLDAMGYKPGGDKGGWLQQFELVGMQTKQPISWDIDVERFVRHEDFILASGVQQAKAEIKDAELVFVGYGIQAPEYDWDDFKGHDLRGKVLVMLNNDPDWDPNLFAGGRRLYYGRWSYKYESAARQGAVGAIIVHTTPSASYPWQVVQTSWSGEQFELPAGNEPRTLINAWLTYPAAQRLMLAAGRNMDALVELARRRDFKPEALGVNTSISVKVAMRSVQSANVLGVLPGSDPALAKQAVVYSAHHDHLGVGPPSFSGAVPGDLIYNGARDNASGLGVVLGIARGLAALPTAPSRSSLIAFVAAEEQGLLGSKYFARNPTFPAGLIAANINFDSPNIFGPTRDVTYVGMGKSDLDDVVIQAAAWQGRTVHGDAAPERGSFYRSDQFSFAAVGIPALYLSAGTEYIGKPADFGKTIVNSYIRQHYHQPSDEVADNWDFKSLRSEAVLGMWAGLLISENPKLPAWKPGDEFEAARQAALQAVSGGGQ